MEVEGAAKQEKDPAFERNVESGETQEMRCYVISGQPEALNAVETALRYLERFGEREVMRLVSVFADGRSGKIRVGVLAGWLEDEESAYEAFGAPLPRVAGEDVSQPHYMVDMTGQR